MYNRYQGNTGRVVRMNDEPNQRPSARPGQRRETPRDSPSRAQPVTAVSGLLEQFGKLLPDSFRKLLPDAFGELETEDIILLLVLYLMYRESGDSELLIIMGAMFLL